MTQDNQTKEATTQKQSQAVLGQTISEGYSAFDSEDSKNESEIKSNESETLEKENKLGEESENLESESDENHDENESEKDEDNIEDKKPKKNGFKKRVDKLNERLRESKNENERLKQELLQAKQSSSDSKQSKQDVSDSKEPNPDDYDSFAAYNKDYLAFLMKQERSKEKEAERESKLKEEYAQKNKTFNEKINEFSKSVDDFDEAIDGAMVSFPLEDAIKSSEYGPKIMYELGKNRDLLDKLNKLDPVSVYREIGKLEASIEKESEKPKLKTITKAPPPITPIKASSSGDSSKRLDEMSADEYMAYRKKQNRR